MNKNKLNKLDYLFEQTTPGVWVSFIEGRDHESGSSFIQTSESDIELSGASEADHDFIALVHELYPEMRKQMVGSDLVNIVSDAFNRSLMLLRENGCICEDTLSKQYYAGSNLYNEVTKAIEKTIDEARNKE